MRFETKTGDITKIKPLIMGFAVVFFGFLLWVTTR